MPLKKGIENIRKNIEELNKGKVSPSRRKAIATYAKKKGISKKEARFKLSLVIAKQHFIKNG